VLRALDLGASEYMVKPFIPEELVARLARLTGEQAR
jgi:DNA-binding response OmpR family regulator